MNQRPLSLLTLIKLQEGHLPDRQGLSVREQLAADSQSRRHWKQLSQIYQQPIQLSAVEEQTEINAATIAAFVEEKLSPEQSAELEAVCWNQPEVIHDVIAAYQSIHSELTAEDVPDEYRSLAATRMHEYLDEQLPPVHKLADMNQIKLAPTSSRRTTLLLVISVLALLLVALPVYYFGFSKPDTTTLTEKDPSVDRPQKATLPHLPVPDEVKPQQIASPDPQPKPETPPVPESMSPVPETPPLVARKPQPAASEPFTAQWVKRTGIIGIRTNRDAPWKGILAAGETQSWEPTSDIEIRTFPSSWLQGNLNAGRELVLDAETSLQLTMQNGAPDQRKSDFKLDLHSGRVALSQLQQGDVIHLQQQRQEWRIEVLKNGTAIAIFQTEPNERELVTFTGAVAVSSSFAEQSQQLSADEMLLFKNQTMSVPLKWRGKQEWRFAASDEQKWNPQFVQSLNQSENLLVSLMATTASRTPAEILSATQLSFELDPVVAVPRAGSSPSELQRTAAIEWLLASRDTPTTAAVWNQLKVVQNAAAPPPPLPVQAWFQLAQRKKPVSRQLLRELSLGLGLRQPLFIRQCSIYFLRQVTRQDLAEYDPAQPTQVAINSVLQKLRRLTGNSGRPAGNGTRRQP